MHRGLSVLTGFVGVLIVLQPTTSSFTAGHLSGIMAAMAAAVNSLITRRIGQKEKTAVMLLYPMVGNFILMGAVLPFVYVPMPITHLGGVALISCLGFMAMFCIVGAYKASNASVIAPMQYSQILWAGFFGVLLFSENITTPFIFGAALIIGSGLYIVKREWNQNRSLQPVLGNGTFRPDIGLRPRFALFGFFMETIKRRKSKITVLLPLVLRFVRLLANKAIGLPLLLFERETLLLHSGTKGRQAMFAIYFDVIQ